MSADLYGLPRSENDIAADPQPGDIYRTSWGYDQTNTEFFEVVRRTKATVTVRRIASRMGIEANGESPHSVFPAPGQYRDDFHLDNGTKVCRLETKRRKWQTEADPIIPGRSLTIDQVRNAWPYSTGGAYDTIAAGHQGH